MNLAINLRDIYHKSFQDLRLTSKSSQAHTSDAIFAVLTAETDMETGIATTVMFIIDNHIQLIVGKEIDVKHIKHWNSFKPTICVFE